MASALKTSSPLRATYADLEAVPRGKVAELVDGELYVFPRPAPRHLYAEGQLNAELVRRFHDGDDGPGGWWILTEPEVHFPDLAHPEGVQAVDPDLAGWRRERMPALPATAFFSLAPDWVCEVLSPSTEDHDRKKKMPLYALNGVPWVWLVDPIARSLEVYELGQNRRWMAPIVHRGDARVRVVPFGDVELNLARLWAPSPGGRR